MADNTLTGVAMTLKYGAAGVSTARHVRNWKMDIEVAESEYATNESGGWTETAIGVKKANGTFEYLYHDGAADEWTLGAIVDVEFHADGGGADHISGNIRLLGKGDIIFDAESGEPVGVTMKWRNHGVLVATGTIFTI